MKVSRILKRRTVAQEAANAGKICVNGREVKPAYRVKAGDVVELTFAAGTLLGGFLGDRYGRKYVILFSILGAAPFTLAMPYLGLGGTIAMSVITGLVIASAFSAIVVYATDLKPDKVGMIAGVFFGLMFGLGGIGSAFFGWLADRTSIEFIFHVSTWLPLLGIVAVFLPDIRPAKTNP